MKNMKCPICSKNLKIADIKGSAFPWKDFSFVELLVSFHALSCQNCGEVIIKSSDATVLDEGLEKSIRIQTSEFLQKIKNNAGLSQKELAKKICITEVYFSEVISMKKTVSCQIFNYFKILANNPDNFRELDCFKGKCAQKKQNNILILSKRFPYLDKNTIKQKINTPGNKTFQPILDTYKNA